MSTFHPTDLLAAYALDALTDEERALVEAHLVDCAVCRGEAARHRAVTEVLVMSVPHADPPSADLRERILRETARTPQLRPVPRPARSPRRVNWPTRLTGWLAAAVLLVASVGLGAWDLSLQNQLRVRSAPPARQLALAATPDAPGATGNLLLDPSEGDVITVNHLPQPGSGKVYEAWVIGASGPKPAGTFLTTPDGHGALVLTQPPGPGQVVAITTEPAPGTPAPTGKVLLEAKTGGAG